MEEKTSVPPRRPLTSEELQGLREIIKEKVNWTPDSFQMEAIEAQLKLLDVLCHAGTGLGKTAIVAGPHMHPSSKGKVMLMVSPLIVLHYKQVSLDCKSKTTYLLWCFRQKPFRMSTG